MIPIRLRHSPTRPPYLTWALMFACTAVMLRLALLPDAQAAAIFEALAVVPARLTGTPFDPSQLLTLLTSAFLHAGWIHLAGNMLYLWVFGPVVEERLGPLLFLVLYLCAGVVGAITFVALAPTSTTPLVGASAAIAGVLGAALFLGPQSSVTAVIPLVVWFEIAELPAIFVIGLWFLLQVASAVAPVVSAAGEAVAWSAHIGGFAAGALLCAAMTTGRGRTTARTRRAV